MRPVSDGFLASLRGSHRAAAQVLAVDGGQSTVDPADPTELAVIRGDVVFDAKAQIRSTVLVEVDGTGLFPRRGSDRLTPFGTELYVRRGLAYGGGRIEYVGLGYFRIDSVEQDEAPDGPIRITGSDRMSGLVDGRLVAPRQFNATLSAGAILEDLVAEIYPDAVIEWDDDAEDDLIGRTMIAEEDRYAFLDDLVTSYGKIWYWDHRGHLIVKDPPDDTAPVWEINSGADGVLVQMGRDLSRAGVYNAVVVTSEAFDSDTPFRAVAVNRDPQSATRWDGPFGRVPRFFSSPFVTNLGQAQRAAQNMLRAELGVPYSVDLGAIANPALELWDPVRVVLRGRKELHIVEGMTIPLTPEQSMTVSTRQLTTVLLGEV